MKNLPPVARQNKIRERFAKQPGAAIAELAREFDVSEMTIRRDLDALERQSHVQRTHGGAILTERMILEFDYRDRRATNHAAKRAIAAEARKLVLPGQRIILDNGTTTLELASLLREDGENLTVITPSLAVASELQHAAGVEVILLGGTLRRGSPDLTGPATEHCLELFAADIAFQGADGIGLDGKIYNSDVRLAHVDKAMRRVAGRSYILADHSKIGTTALACSGTLANVTGLITSKGAPAAVMARLAKVCPKIIAVKP